jgi:tellurite resistance protein TerC
MVLTDIFHIPTPLSLLVIALVLAAAILASLWRARTIQARETASPQEPVGSKHE